MNESAIQEEATWRIAYQSVCRGFTATETDEETVYYGKLIRVNRDNYFTDPGHLELEEKFLEEIRAGEWIPDGGSFPPGGIIERHEIFEVDTDDVLIMYRMPAQEAHGKKVLPAIDGMHVISKEDAEDAPVPDDILGIYGMYVAIAKVQGLAEANVFASEVAAMAAVSLAKRGFTSEASPAHFVVSQPDRRH